ncbi:hypothetical protein KC19_VG048800 [Ceratodon purpureus]|uniref:No apical meristem-associated C-terminal domain-containing protein n=1 Tax=Ceratodon purpureus TaxID=3225 RepID=A0A8T0HMI8_CERPU|nr:hypothetical protein KC19_VG048800 [Ceratodon purpureus]
MDDHCSTKTRDVAIRAQLAATKEMAKATKRKAKLLEDQNLIMLMIADKTGIINDDAREWVILQRKAELQKLRKRFAEEEEEESRLPRRSLATTSIHEINSDDQPSYDTEGEQEHRRERLTSEGDQLCRSGLNIKGD